VGLLTLEANIYDQTTSDLPSAARRGLMKALVMLGSTCEDQASRTQYWERVLKPLNDKFNALVEKEDLRRIHNDDKVRKVVANILESVIGEDQNNFFR
jgi:hypothetical protein